MTEPRIAVDILAPPARARVVLLDLEDGPQ
jgi:hypothetical protein